MHSKPPLMQSKKASLWTNLSKNEWPGQDKFNSSRCIRLEKAGYRALLRDKSYVEERTTHSSEIEGDEEEAV